MSVSVSWLNRSASISACAIMACIVYLFSFGTSAAFTQDRVGVAPVTPANVISTKDLRLAALNARPTIDEIADGIVIYKSRRMMYLMKDGRIQHKYQIALGKNPIGHKLESGDNRTPEGKYTIDLKNPDSSYFLSIRISYPDDTDADVATALETKPGDWIMIHGLPNGRDAVKVGHPRKDWTNGCIAVTNLEMAEIWRKVKAGTPISIWP